MKFDFTNFNEYKEFSDFVNQSDTNTKGDYSEEFWRRWLHTVPWLNDVVKIWNLNDSKSKTLLSTFPELKILRIGTPSSRLADLLIEYKDGYDLVSCKWWQAGLTLSEIGTFYGVTKQQLPNIKKKYVITNAPRTSKAAQEIFKNSDTSTISIFEDQFLLDKKEWLNIKNWVEGQILLPSKWSLRNNREWLTLLKSRRELCKNDRAQMQGPPGVGKTQLMFLLDLYHFKKYGGITVNMGDSSLNVKQNFDHFTSQYKAYGITRPVAVINPGAIDNKNDLEVDFPIEVFGRDYAKIRTWIRKNPTGLIFCFYGNTIALEKSLGKKEVTFVSCDEASRTCHSEGTGWSHIVHDHRIKAKKRFFVDATPKRHKQVGMFINNAKENIPLYGKQCDFISQPEAEKYGSVTSFYIKGLVIDGKKSSQISQKFHNRDMVQGKSYTVEDYIQAYQLLFEKANDHNDQHTLCFGTTIKRIKQSAEAMKDVITDLQKEYPNNKRYKELDDIEIYVADTHIHTTLDIHLKLDNIYAKKKRSIVLTSRLLYRAWSQVKLDSIMFLDNFSSKTYIIQALGRGLRKNPNKTDKILKIIIPADYEKPESWQAMFDTIAIIGTWDTRPIDALVNFATKPRSKGQRKPMPGGVVISGSGVKINIKDVSRSVKTYLVNNKQEWMNWTEWHSLAKDYLDHCRQYKEMFFEISGNGSNGHQKNYINKQVFDKICGRKSYKTLIEKEYSLIIKKNKNARTMPISSWVNRKIFVGGFKLLKNSEFWIDFMSALDDWREENTQQRDIAEKEISNLVWDLREKHIWYEGGGQALDKTKNPYILAFSKDMEKQVKPKVNKLLETYYQHRKVRFTDGRTNGTQTWRVTAIEISNRDKERKQQYDKLKTQKITEQVELAQKLSIEQYVKYKRSFTKIFGFVSSKLDPIFTYYSSWAGPWGKWVMKEGAYPTKYSKEFFERIEQEKTRKFKFTDEELLCSECGTNPCMPKIKAESHKGIPWNRYCKDCFDALPRVIEKKERHNTKNKENYQYKKIKEKKVA